LIAGSLYLWGNISIYIVSYFRSLGDDWLTVEKASFIYPISMTIHNIVGPIGAAMQKKYNPKIIMLIGSALMFLSYYLSSYTTKWD
jgi:hypothetical protein